MRSWQMASLLWCIRPKTLRDVMPLVLPILKECVGGAEKDPAMRIGDVPVMVMINRLAYS